MRTYLIPFIMLAILSCSVQPAEIDRGVIEYAKENGFPIKSNSVSNADPAILFCYSAFLWNEGQKDDAVFWYYVAQYRYRILFSSAERLQAGSFSEDAAKEVLLKTGVYDSEQSLEKLHLIGGMYRIELYELIQEIFGAEINGYAYGYLEGLKTTIDEVLEYEEKYPFNTAGLRPRPVMKDKQTCSEWLEKVRESYIDQKQEIDDKAHYIRATRQERGLENRWK